MKINLIEAIRNVERPAPSPENRYAFDSPIDDLADELNLQPFYSWPDELDLRIREYPLGKWHCTDSHVGLSALYLDGEPMGCIFQSGRKMGKQFRWLSKECADRVRQIIISYMADEEVAIDVIDPSEEIDDHYVVAYVEQLLNDDGFFHGKPVRALVRYSTYNETKEEYRRPGRSYYEKVPRGHLKDQCLLVTDGKEEFCIPVGQFKIPLALKKVDE